MGAPIAYECRREELAAMSSTTPTDTDPSTTSVTSPVSPVPVSPEPWVSFLGSTDPAQGLLTRYLELGQIAAVVGDVLFVHGAVHEHNMGYVAAFAYKAFLLLIFLFHMWT